MSRSPGANTNGSLGLKLWRGERMCLLGMNVGEAEPDFVGFSIEVKSPGQADFLPLRNRLNFQYTKPASEAVDGFRNFPSTQSTDPKVSMVAFSVRT